MTGESSKLDKKAMKALCRETVINAVEYNTVCGRSIMYDVGKIKCWWGIMCGVGGV